MNPENDPTSRRHAKSLKHLAIHYDLEVLKKEAQEDYEIQLENKELVDQASISKHFNLKEKLNARN